MIHTADSSPLGISRLTCPLLSSKLSKGTPCGPCVSVLYASKQRKG